MVHKSRTFSVAAVATAGELAEKLTAHTWTLCTAFELGGYLFCNDSFSENGAQEWAVCKDGRQLESVTFSWMTSEKALVWIENLLAGKLSADVYAGAFFGAFAPRTNHRKAGACQLCA